MKPATRSDIPAMVALLERHHVERAFAFPFDAALASMDLAAAIDNPEVLCLTDDGCILIAICSRPLGSPERIAIEIMLRCEQPAKRKPLVAAFESWARSRGCRRVSLSSTHDYEAFKRLYRPDGYTPAEMVFAKELVDL
jgi:GNAT superfamily N-acetyltransferase